MKKIITFLICIFYLFSLQGQSTGLVFSGGGAKGAVHIGILKALEDNNIPIDYISGTSIGAVVGSLYSIGYSPDEILDLFMSDNFNHWQTGKIEDMYRFYFRKPPDMPDLMRVLVPFKDSVKMSSSMFPTNLINPVQINQAFMQLYAQADAQSKCNFDSLFVPFLCTASDVYNKKSIIFRHGKLEDAVRASMTFPLVFKPIYHDSIPLFDGGIYDNFPVNAMKTAFHPDFIIGSSVIRQKRLEDMGMYDFMENMIMQQTVYDVNPEDGITMKFDLEDVNLMDFYKSRELFEIGYNRTVEMISQIKSHTGREVKKSEVDARRLKYKESLPPMRFRNIYITGINNAQKHYFENQINRGKDNYFSIEEFKRNYFRLLSNSKVQEIFPSAVYDAENNVFDLFLDVKIKDEIGIGFGGNVSSMSANQLYLGLSYQNLTTVASKINLDMQVGNSFSGASLSGRIELPTPVPIDIYASIFYNYYKYFKSDELFIDAGVFSYIHQRETFGKIGFGFPLTYQAKVEIMTGYGVLEDKYHADEFLSATGFDVSLYKFFHTGTFFTKNTMDSKQYELRGKKHHFFLQYISGEEKFTPANHPQNPLSMHTQHHSWLQIEGMMYNMYNMNRKFNLGFRVQGVASTKQFLNNYQASILQAPTYSPTPHSIITFNQAFRAYNYFAGGLIPVFKLNSTFHVRGDFHGFFPVWPVQKDNNNVSYKGSKFDHSSYLGEIAVVARLPFMNISLFGNYYSYPARNWNFGLNIGYLIFAPRFIQQ
ncbi:MAG: patatin-like phospholipase family protein [Dysgonamonadaceae bacterium]|jgi:NTE family protein|nr:patatin-like phospholipase family protein [Dysgonamonadaceae bacterium]